MNPTCQPTSNSQKFALTTGNIGTESSFNADSDALVKHSATEEAHKTSLAISNHPVSNAILVSSRKKASLTLSHNEFMEVANQLHGACERKRKFGVMVSGFMLQMLQVAKGQDAEVLDDEFDSVLEKNFPLLINKYKTSFKPVKTAKFNAVMDTSDVASVDRSITAPTKSLGHSYAPMGRLKSNMEQCKSGKKIKKAEARPISVTDLTFRKARTPKRMKQTCSFCGSSEHRKATACPVLKGLGHQEQGSEIVTYLK